MKYRHTSAHSQRFVVLILLINHLGLQPACLIPTHQNSKPLLMSPYTIVTHILFYKSRTYFVSVKISMFFLLIGPYCLWSCVYTLIAYLLFGFILSVFIHFMMLHLLHTYHTYHVLVNHTLYTHFFLMF